MDEKSKYFLMTLTFFKKLPDGELRLSFPDVKVNASRIVDSCERKDRKSPELSISTEAKNKEKVF